MDKIAFLFPGQGSQYIGMGQDFFNEFEASKAVFKQATDQLDIDMEALCFEENDQLNITEYTQIAMLTATVAILRRVEQLGIKADVTAGLSLGEYAALVASEAISFEDAIKVVRQRGIYMQDAVPAGQGAMSAVLGSDQGTIEDICQKTPGIVTIANYNCPGQIVITGESGSVAAAGEAILAAGAKRVIPLNVSGPFHSELLKEAGAKLLQVLADVTIKDPVIPYVTNVTAGYVSAAKDIKELLGQQVYSSVCWQQSIERMIADGVTIFIEMGPGKTLSGFLKKIDRSKTVISIEKAADLEKLKEIEGYTC